MSVTFASSPADATGSPTFLGAVVGVVEVDEVVELDSEQTTLRESSPPQEFTQAFPSPAATPAKVFVLARLWRSLSHSMRPTTAPTHLSHSALVLYSVLTGNSSAAPTTSASTRRRSQRLSKSPAPSPPSHPLNASPAPSAPSPEVTLVDVERARVPIQSPRVSKNAVKRLKSDLLRQRKAVRIVKDIRTLDSPAGSATTKAYALRVLPLDDAPPSPIHEPAFTMIAIPPSTPSSPGFSIPTSQGAVAGLAGAKTGAFDLAAEASGAILRPHQTGLVAPLDRMAVFIFWWGFEMTLPPPVLTTLSQVHSVSNTLFTFLQAFVISGGAPELAPFVKYLSSYVDLEWSAIQSENRGHGVVLAATWLLPVALVPRPWDFPLPSPPPIVVSPPDEDEPATVPTLSPVEVGVIAFPVVQVQRGQTGKDV